MRIFKTIITAMALGIAAVSCTENKIPVISIEGGRIQGVKSEARGVTVYKGIPYAAPPVDSLRWRLPKPVELWDGIKQADTFGPAAPQADLTEMDLYGKEFYSDGMPQMSEDCLYLNVWTPTEVVGNTEAGLPVAVWIHGGAFDHGWGYEKAMDGDAWAKKGVILVTINYRVGIFGFFAHPLITKDPKGDLVSGNFGLFDQAYALGWVNRNIAKFGGDPSNVTILGQSAGARSVQDLCAAPIVKRYVHKAIIQSGGGINTSLQHPTHLEEMEEQGKQFGDFAGYETLEQLRSASYDELMQKLEEYKATGARLHMRPCVDFGLVGRSFTSAAAINQVFDIPYMIGCVTGDGERQVNDIDQFCASRVYYSGAPVYEYIFKRALPGDDRGAFHSAELWYMFGTLDRCWRPFTKADYKLSEEMLTAWTNFCKYGDPNDPEGEQTWPAFDSRDPFRKIFDIPEE